MKKSYFNKSIKKILCGITGTVMMCGVIFTGNNTVEATGSNSPNDNILQINGYAVLSAQATETTPAGNLTAKSAPTSSPTPYIDPDSYIEPKWRDKTGFITSGIYTYRITDAVKKEIEIRGITSTEKKIIIPQSIDGYKVTGIGYSGEVSAGKAYSSYGLTYVEDYETLKLAGCENTLEEIVIPAGVKFIGACVFKDFAALQRVEINSEELVVIYGRAFDSCYKLADINIPAKAHLGDDTFRDCRSLQNLTLSEDNLDDISCLISGTHIDCIHITASGSEPDSNSCYSIDNYMFGFGTHIKKVIVDKDIPGIDLGMNVDELMIKGKNTRLINSNGNGKESVGKTTIVTVKGAKAIAFAKKYKLDYRIKCKDKCIIKKGILLKYTGSKKTFRVPGKVKKISSGAFKNEYNMTKMIIGSNVEKIGRNAIKNANSLKTIVVSKKNKHYSSFMDMLKIKSVKVISKNI